MSIVGLADEIVPTTSHPAPPAGRTIANAIVTLGIFASLLCLPLVAAQGAALRRRIPRLPPADPPHHGLVPGSGRPIRLLAVGESTVAGIGLTRGDETVAATAAQALASRTQRPVAWRAMGLSGATASDGLRQLLPRIERDPADLLILAFSVNDVIAYRSPEAFANDLLALVVATRRRIGNAAVVIAGVAPISAFPALPWPLRTILGWRSTALQIAADGLQGMLPRVAVERISVPLEPHLFAIDGFHPNAEAHAIWGDGIASLALPLLASN